MSKTGLRPLPPTPGRGQHHDCSFCRKITTEIRAEPEESSPQWLLGFLHHPPRRTAAVGRWYWDGDTERHDCCLGTSVYSSHSLALCLSSLPIGMRIRPLALSRAEVPRSRRQLKAGARTIRSGCLHLFVQAMVSWSPACSGMGTTWHWPGLRVPYLDGTNSPSNHTLGASMEVAWPRDPASSSRPGTQ